MSQVETPTAQPSDGPEAIRPTDETPPSHSAEAASATLSDDGEHPALDKLARELPGKLGDVIATLVVLITFALFVWSLIATWSGEPHNAPSLFNTVVVGTVVGGVAIIAHKTFSYYIAIIGAAAWLVVSMVPFVPIAQIFLQVVTILIMIIGANVALEAVSYNKKRYTYSS